MSEVKRSLTVELASVMRAALKEENTDQVLSSDVTINVCNVTEAIFIHGLKDAYFLNKSRFAKYPEPNFWPFVSKFVHGNVRSQISSFNQIKSDIGKSRAWIRLALNEGVIENYVQAISRDRASLRFYYRSSSYLRDSEQIEVFTNYMKALMKLKFSAPVNSRALNEWTPTPLRLAGLLKANHSAQAIYASSGYPEMEDLEDDVPIGIPAEDFYGLSESPGSGPDLTRLARERRESVLSDDNSSVFSHPSLLDTKFNEVMSQLARAKSPGSSGTPGPTFEEDLTDSGLSSGGLGEVKVRRRGEKKPTPPRKKSLTDSCVQTDALPETEEPSSLTPPAPPPAEMSTCSLVGDESFVTASETPPQAEKTLEEPVGIPPREPSPPGALSTSAPLSFSLGPPSSANEERDRSFSPLGNSLMGVRYGWSSNALDASDGRGSSFMDRLEPRGSFNTVLRSALLDEPQVVESSGSGSGFAEEMNQETEIGRAITDHLVHDNKEDELSRESRRGYSPGEEFVVIESPERDREAEESSRQADRLQRFRLLTEPGTEAGLDAQSFQCRSCRRPIGLMYGEFRVCAFDGFYYCADCHRNDEAKIPTRILLSWDLSPRKVSRANKAFLNNVTDKPLIHVDQVNPSLYEASEEMLQVLNLRKQLGFASAYLMTCKESVADDLRKRLWPKEYLHSDVHLYSLTDLISASEGVLQKHVQSMINYAIAHVTACRLCSQKGFICELCNDSQIIYPFQTEVVHRCEVCYSVFHQRCIRSRCCPKCERRKQYYKDASLNDSLVPDDS